MARRGCIDPHVDITSHDGLLELVVCQSRRLGCESIDSVLHILPLVARRNVEAGAAEPTAMVRPLVVALAPHETLSRSRPPLTPPPERSTPASPMTVLAPSAACV